MTGMRLEHAVGSWMIELKAANRAPRTIETYTLATDQLGDWLKQSGHSMEVTGITTTDVRGFIGHMLDTRSAATAKQRYGSLSVFFNWLLTEGEIETNPMAKVSRPKVVEDPVQVIRTDDFEAIVATCDQSFLGRRDRAVLMLLWDTGLRVGELIGLRVSDVHFGEDPTVIVDGKTGIREAPFTAKTAAALDGWIRWRRRHRNADLRWLWLSERGRGEHLTKSGVHRLLERHAAEAGIGHVFPHQFRHSCADRLLSAGVPEGSVMEIMGWSSRDMLDRYGRSVRHRRAIADYRKYVG
jgi:integrase/recombinase XerC